MSYSPIKVEKEGYDMPTVEEIESILDDGHTDQFIQELAAFRESGQDINKIDRAGYTWLTRAMASTYNLTRNPQCIEERVRAVLAAGADPNAPNDETLPLMYACGWQFGYGLGPQARLVQLLLSAGADPSPKISIDIPATIFTDDGEIDFSDDEVTTIESVDAWLADIEKHNDYIQSHSPEYTSQCIQTRKEITEIRCLLEEARSSSSSS